MFKPRSHSLTILTRGILNDDLDLREHYKQGERNAPEVGMQLFYSYLLTAIAKHANRGIPFDAVCFTSILRMSRSVGDIPKLLLKRKLRIM